MRLSALFLLLIGVAAPAHADVPPRTIIPIREVDLSDGARRYVMTLLIDGQPVDVGIDTGSTGLRVLPRALGEKGKAAHGAATAYHYGSGTAFSGPVIRVSVAAGPIDRVIDVMRIDGVGCVESRADCPASRVDLHDFGIQSDGLPGEGFAAILGIRLQDDRVANPFVALGVKRWIVDLPQPGKGAGQMILNPDDAEVAAYRRIALDSAARAPGCLVGPPAQGRICGLTIFDTGAPGLRIFANRSGPPWPNGTSATLTIGSGKAEQSATVSIGRRDQAAGMVPVVRPRQRETSLSFGLAPYFIWSVLYDAGHQELGLKPR